ncbi:MAG: 30S ribosomal protein S18 [Caldilineaceae bacterium]|nr:30S ribosomal protein S18 [Caldilineaceae bacterium]
MAEKIRDEEEEEVRRPVSNAPQRPGRPQFDETDDDSDDDDVVDADDYDNDDDDDISYTDGPVVFARTKDGRRRNPRHVGNEVKLEDIGYKKVTILSRFVDNRGRIYSRRKTRVSAKMQRKVTTAIKRARHLALMPYTGEHVRITRKHGG